VSSSEDTAPHAVPFSESLCHACDAPPRYVRSDRGAVFIHCPILKRYPPQPVLTCDAYVPRVVRQDRHSIS
jgi:hypothetical protein